jgi:histone-lysine N-methyltransferase SETD2
MMECVGCHKGCKNQRFQRRHYANIDVVETQGKGYGLVAREILPRGTFVNEYFGELISLKELQRRMLESKERGERHLYAMQLSNKCYIDSRRKGSIGRFINHSCEPNCTVEVWTF